MRNEQRERIPVALHQSIANSARHAPPGTCRLPFVRRMLALWDGPASVAVYVPLPKSAPEAAACRKRVLAYLSTTADKLRRWRQQRAGAPEAPPDHPLHVSFLYATARVPNMGCDLSEDSTGLEEGTMDEALWRQQFEGKPYIDIYDAEYPVGALRQLALDAVRRPSSRASSRASSRTSRRRNRACV